MSDGPANPEVGATRSFYQRIYTLVRAVPEGKVTTYGAIALALSSPRQARQVGQALAALPDYEDVPAHRVVNRSGVLTGEHAFGPPGTMRALLEAEGVTFDENGRVAMGLHFHEPDPA